MNIWEHGEKCHPGIVSLAQTLFDEAGYKINIKTLTIDPQKTRFYNYWISTPEFWCRYIEFCEPLYQLIESTPDRQLKRLLLKQADKRGHCFIPYVFERLFSTLLCVNKDIRAKAWHKD